MTQQDLAIIGFVALNKLIENKDFQKGNLIKIPLSVFPDRFSVFFKSKNSLCYSNIFIETINNADCLFLGFSIKPSFLEFAINSNEVNAFFNFLDFIDKYMPETFSIYGKNSTYETFVSVIKTYSSWVIKQDFMTPVAEYIPQIIDAAMEDVWLINPEACKSIAMYAHIVDYAGLLDFIFSEGV